MAQKNPSSAQGTDDSAGRGRVRIWGEISVAAMVLGTLGWVSCKVVDLESRISKLEARFETVLQLRGPDGSHSKEPNKSGGEPAPPSHPGVAVLNFDVPLPSGRERIRLRSPIRVEWRAESNMVVQVYREDNIIFPDANPHEEHSSGFVLPRLSPGAYEIKLWIPGTNKPYKSIGVQVVE